MLNDKSCGRFQVVTNQNTKNRPMFDDVWRRKSLCEHDAKCNNFHITYTAYWATKNAQTFVENIFTVERRHHCVDMISCE